MEKMNLEQISEAMAGRIICGDPQMTVSRVVRDSRDAARGDLFFAIKGENHDGHGFIENAYRSGCRCFVVSDMSWCGGTEHRDMGIIRVADTVGAMQDLARAYLKRLGPKVIGITGSTGKTSTKDMVYNVCSERYRTGRTEGNYNNDIGLPLTILGFTEDIEVAVLEMGMDHFGEIDRLAGIAEPDIGIITNIGVSHMENLGSRSGIMKAKMEITSRFTDRNTLIISTGKDFLRRENISGPFALITTGTDIDDDYHIANLVDHGDLGISFTIVHGGEEQELELGIPGRHNALNAALAVAAGGLLGIDMKTAAAGLEKAKLTEGRMTVRTAGSIRVIDDTYNASPDSVRSALDVLGSSEAEERIAILGDMMLGSGSEEMHREIGTYAAACGADIVAAIGRNARAIADGAGVRGVYFSSKKEFIDNMSRHIHGNSVVLVKGSRGMAMEEIVQALMDMGDNR